MVDVRLGVSVVEASDLPALVAEGRNFDAETLVVDRSVVTAGVSTLGSFAY